MTHPVHSVETAPAAASEALSSAAKAFGFVPNLYGVMAAAPPLLEAYQTLGRLFDRTSFTTTERQIVMLATSYENGCEYCVAAHSAIAGMQQVPAAVVEALRTGQPIADPKLEALRRFTAAVTTTRARPSEADTIAFVAAGYTPAQALEVVLGVGMKTLSNYTNHIANTPLDAAFAPAAWSASA